MSVFWTAYLIVGVYYVLNDLFHESGMKFITQHPKWVYFLCSTIAMIFWLPILILSMFSFDDEKDNNKPGGPTPH